MELKIVRLAMRRMLITSKRPKPIESIRQVPKIRIGVSHRRKK